MSIVRRAAALAVLALVIAAPAAAQSPVYREDTAHVSGHYGSLFFCVRQDVAAALAANGDYIPCIVDATGRLWTSSVQSGAWTVAATQSGGWTVSVSNSFLLDATFTARINTLGQKAMTASTPVVLASDQSALAVTGTFWQATQPVSGTVSATQSGTWTVQPGNTANTTPWLTRINDGTDSALVSGTGSLQVTCDNCGAPATFADNSAFTFGTTGVSNVGFVFDDVATNAVAENSAGAARITTNRAVHVNLRNNTGTEISPLTDTQLRATPVPVSGTVTVTDGAGALNVIVDSGSVTANAGTNLNTSALALEAGGNLAGAATSLGVLDDWDEIDRVKVNPIAGQAGVQGASGTVTALTQRVVLATDVGLPAGAAALGSVTTTRTSLTMNAPAAASVGVASAAAVSANASRKGLFLTNTSSATISLAFGAPAVLNSGITLLPGGTFNMNEYSFSTAEVRAIASAAASNLSVQESQ